MIIDNILHLTEPIDGNLRKYLPLPGDTIRQDNIKGRYSVRGYKDKAVPEIINISYFTPSNKIDIRHICLKYKHIYFPLANLLSEIFKKYILLELYIFCLINFPLKNDSKDIVPFSFLF